MSDLSINTILSVGAGGFAAYVAVRVGLASLQATFTTMMAEIARRLDRMETSRDTHANELGALRTKVAEQAVEIEAIQGDVRDLQMTLDRLQREDLHKLKNMVTGLSLWKEQRDKESQRRMPALRQGENRTPDSR